MYLEKWIELTLERRTNNLGVEFIDPVTVILTALVAGTAKAAGDAVPDGYKALKELIKKKFTNAGKSGAEFVLTEHEKKPEEWKKPLESVLVETGADKDEEIIKKAEELLKQLKQEETAANKLKTEFHAEVKAAQVGEHNKQENNFA